MRRIFLFLFFMGLGTAFAQEGALHADFRRWTERVDDACGTFSFKTIPGCAYTLFTDHPIHIAVGSIAPKNGFGFGAAFVTHYTPNENWRLSWDFDAVGATSGSWRAGGYMKIIHTPIIPITVIHPGSSSAGAGGKKPTVAVHQYTVFNVYAQSISLSTLYFFGLGNNSAPAGKSVFGMRETIFGTNVIKPLNKFSLSLLGEVNGRFVDLRGNHHENLPSIEQLYTNATAPGLATQPGFAQLGEGIRFKPVLFNDYLQLNYLGTFQQFFAPSDSRYSFMRWTADFGHNFLLYGRTLSPTTKDTNGPDECATAVGAEKCPPVSVSRNRNGTIGLRLLLSESLTSASSVVPFYFQPTLGGSDINGNPTLSSYLDYRFRGPNVLVLRESFEHSLWGPFGVNFLADQGRVALTHGDLGFSHLKHSYAAGLTVRGGGLPEIFLLYAWGGNEGTHTIVSVSPTLLGGSYRPSLY
jgi:hypothetical protein